MSNEPKSNKKTDAINGSFTLSESPDEKLQGTYEIKKTANKTLPKNTLDKWLKITALLAVIVGIYGFFFQKGMVSAMGMKYSLVNIDIKEIYYYSYLGVLDVFDKVSSLKIVDGYLDFVYLFLMFFVSGSIFYFTIKPSGFILKSVSYFDSNFKVFYEIMIEKWYFFSLAFSAICVVINFIFPIIFKYFFAIVLFFLLLPGLSGHYAGVKYINNLESSDCEVYSPHKTYAVGSNICPILTIKGKSIPGEIVLETSNSYFIKEKNYFLYITKNGENCAFSHYLNTKNVEEKLKFTLDPDIEALCFKKTDIKKENNS
jgi:hypothetical protein